MIDVVGGVALADRAFFSSVGLSLNLPSKLVAWNGTHVSHARLCE